MSKASQQRLLLQLHPKCQHDWLNIFPGSTVAGDWLWGRGGVTCVITVISGLKEFSI